MCQLIYHELESVKGITAEQYEAAIQKYPVLGQLYTLLKELYITVKMYPCSGGTDTGSPEL